jgi:TolA-binding protein
MAKLRDLQGAAPLLSLQLAREGNQRFPGSADAPERTWYVVKSLSDLGRHDEARDEARKMLGLFPNNRFTSDVVRHTLNHPPSPPNQ